MNGDAACQRYREELLALRLGEEPEVSAEDLRQHLGSCADCRGLQDEFAEMSAALEAAQPKPSADGARRLRLAIATLEGGGKAVSRPSTRQSLLVFAAAAAVVVAAVLVAEFSNRKAPAAVLVQIENGPASVGAKDAWQPGDGLPAGSQLRFGADGRVRLAFKRGTEVEFAGPSDFEVAAADRVMLRRGRLLASVRKGAEPFTVQTAHGRVVTLGTRFAVESDAAGTRVAVFEGRVRFQGAFGAGVEVAAGQSSRLSAGGTPSLPAGVMTGDLAWLLPAPRPQIDLELVPARAELLPGQRLMAQLRLVNRSAVAVSLDPPGRAMPAYFLRLTDPAGRSSYLCPTVLASRLDGAPSGAAVFTLTPGSCYQLDLDLGTPLESPGQYRLAAIYFGALRSDSANWSGTIESRAENVQVKAPPPPGGAAEPGEKPGPR